jgi:hypothetical protein
VISSFEVRDKVHWGSLSAHQPSAGFYGQLFSFDEPVILKSISVFVYDHPDHTETESSINFGVWAFDGGPTDEIYRGLWLTRAYPSRVDGSSGWIQIPYARPSVECPTAADCALMIRVNVADAREANYRSS